MAKPSHRWLIPAAVLALAVVLPGGFATDGVAAACETLRYANEPMPGPAIRLSNSTAPQQELAHIGQTLYAAGDVTAARGTGDIGWAAQDGITAFDTRTGRRRTGFHVTSDADISSVLAVGQDLYLAGSFTRINGAPRQRIAKVSALTGSVDPVFNAGADQRGRPYGLTAGRVHELAVDPTTGHVLAAGNLPWWRDRAGSTDPGNLLRLDSVTGTRIGDRSPRPAFTRTLTTLHVTPAGRTYVGAVDHADGTDGVALHEVHRDGSHHAALDHVLSGQPGWPRAVASNAERVVVGYQDIGGAGEFVASYDQVTQERRWTHFVGHDVHAVTMIGEDVFISFHDDYRGDPTIRILQLDAATGQVRSDFRPRFGTGAANTIGPNALLATGNGLAAFGVFTTIADKPHANLAWFPAVTATCPEPNTPNATPAPDPSGSPPTVGRIRPRIAVRAINRRSRLYINVNPNRSRGDYRLVVKQRRAGRWHVVRRTSSRGRAELRRVNLPKGRYRVHISNHEAFTRARSRPISLRR